MTQIINEKLKKCCNQCNKYMDSPCAWLSLGNEYCDEIMGVNEEIERLNNIIKEAREYIEKDYIYIQQDAYNKLLKILNKGE